MPPENSPREPPEWCRSAHAALSMLSVSQQCFQAVEGTPAGRRGGRPTTWPDALRTATKHRCDTANIDDGVTAVPSVLGRGRAAGRDTGSGRARLDTGFLELVSLRSCRACLIICDAYSPYFN